VEGEPDKGHAPQKEAFRRFNNNGNYPNYSRNPLDKPVQILVQRVLKRGIKVGRHHSYSLVNQFLALKNRSRVEILYDIVASARSAAKKTHLMYKSNLSFKQLDLYLGYILQNGLLEERLDEEGSRMYCLTNKGNEFLSLFEHLQTFFPNMKPHEEAITSSSDNEKVDASSSTSTSFVF